MFELTEKSEALLAANYLSFTQMAVNLGEWAMPGDSFDPSSNSFRKSKLTLQPFLEVLKFVAKPIRGIKI